MVVLKWTAVAAKTLKRIAAMALGIVGVVGPVRFVSTLDRSCTGSIAMRGWSSEGRVSGREKNTM